MKGKEREPRRAAGRVLAGALLACAGALACGSGEVGFRPETDARFAAAVLGEYAAGSISLRVCEDLDPGALACTVPSTTECGSSCHVIRGAGQASAESLSAGGRGCDCSSPTAELSVRGELVLGDGSRLTLRGTIATAPTEDDPYGPPVALRLSAGDEDARSGRVATTLRGELRDGQARLRLSRPPPDAGALAWPAGPDTGVSLARSGPCP